MRPSRNTKPYHQKTLRNSVPKPRTIPLTLLIYAYLIIIILAPPLIHTPHSNLITNTHAQQQSIVVNSVKITQEYSDTQLRTSLNMFLVSHDTKDQIYEIKVTNGKIIEPSLLSLIDAKPIRTEYKYNNNTSSLKLYFTSSQLPIGEEKKVTITYYMQIPQIQNNYTTYKQTWMFQTPITILKLINTYPNYLLLNTTSINPNPTVIYTQPQYTQITWLKYNNNTLTTTVSLKKEPTITEFHPFTVTPQTILVMVQPNQKQTLTFTLQNHYYKDLNITVFTTQENLFQVQQHKITLPYNQSVSITITVISPEQDAKGTLFLTTLLAKPVTQVITIYFKPTTTGLHLTPTQVTALILIFTATLLTLFFILKPPKHFINKLRNPKPSTSTSTSNQITSKTPITPPPPSIHPTPNTNQNEPTINPEYELSLLKSPRFDENEKRVLRFLLAQNNVVQQRIAESLQLSKATVSRVITKLEQKNLITKKKIGMSNKVLLNKTRLTQIINEQNKHTP